MSMDKPPVEGWDFWWSADEAEPVYDEDGNLVELRMPHGDSIPVQNKRKLTK